MNALYSMLLSIFTAGVAGVIAQETPTLPPPRGFATCTLYGAGARKRIFEFTGSLFQNDGRVKIIQIVPWAVDIESDVPARFSYPTWGTYQVDFEFHKKFYVFTFPSHESRPEGTLELDGKTHRVFCELKPNN